MRPIIAFALLAAAWPALAATPPAQPKQGPGGADYPAAAVHQAGAGERRRPDLRLSRSRPAERPAAGGGVPTRLGRGEPARLRCLDGAPGASGQPRPVPALPGGQPDSPRGCDGGRRQARQRGPSRARGGCGSEARSRPRGVRRPPRRHGRRGEPGRDGKGGGPAGSQARLRPHARRHRLRRQVAGHPTRRPLGDRAGHPARDRDRRPRAPAQRPTRQATAPRSHERAAEP